MWYRRGGGGGACELGAWAAADGAAQRGVGARGGLEQLEAAVEGDDGEPVLVEESEVPAGGDVEPDGRVGG